MVWLEMLLRLQPFGKAAIRIATEPAMIIK